MPKTPPIALILFSNDLDSFLPSVERERKTIEEALEGYNDTNRLKVIARSSVSIDEIFRLFNRYQGRISIFHFAGHAGGKGLQLNKDFSENETGKVPILLLHPNLLTNTCCNREASEMSRAGALIQGPRGMCKKVWYTDPLG